MGEQKQNSTAELEQSEPANASAPATAKQLDATDNANSTAPAVTLAPDLDPAARRPFFTKQVIIVCLVLFCGSFLAYGLSAGKRFWKRSDNIHFVDLAHSFWKGQWWALWKYPGQKPWTHPRTNDWSRQDLITVKNIGKVRGIYVTQKTYGYNFYTTDGRGLVVDHGDLERTCGKNKNQLCKEARHFVSFPPGPAVLMMPLVKVWGWQLNDIIFTIFFASLNVVLIFLMIRLLTLRGYCTRTMFESAALAVLFGFGTVAWFSSMRGEVWFTALVLGVSFHLLYLLAALDLKHPLLAGIALAIGFSCRTTIVFSSLFFFLQLGFPKGRFIGNRWKEQLPKLIAFVIPCLIVGVLILMYNHARFDSFTEFGHRYLPNWAGDRIRLKGIFSPRHLNRNLAALFAQVPVIITNKPWVKISSHGLAIWFTTPIFFYLLWPKVKGHLHRFSWLTVALIAAPILLYQNTGWLQFGYRFSLDFAPYLFILLAIGGRRFGALFYSLFVFAVAVNLFGALSFNSWKQYYFNGFLEP